MMKVCTTCEKELPVERFAWANKLKTYRRGDCKGCTIDKARRRPGHQLRHRYYQLKYKYGLSKPDADAMLERQQHHCAICPAPVTIFSHADHDHRTGQVRGFLCRNCNWLLGQAQDDPERLRAAIAYLEGSCAF